MYWTVFRITTLITGGISQYLLLQKYWSLLIISSWQQSRKVYFWSFVFTGETSSGKSRLVNLILGEEILPYSILSSTSIICELKFAEERKIEVHFRNEDRSARTIVLTSESSEQSYLEQISSFVHVDSHREEGSGFKKIVLFWPHKLLEVIVVLKLCFVHFVRKPHCGCWYLIECGNRKFCM